MYWEPFDEDTTIADLRPFLEAQQRTDYIQKIDGIEPDYNKLIAVAAAVLLITGMLMIVLAIELKAIHR